MTRLFLPLLLKGSGKTIVNITSIASQLLVRGASAYSTSKLAMLRFSEFTNLEYGAQGILAYSLHPVRFTNHQSSFFPQRPRIFNPSIRVLSQRSWPQMLCPRPWRPVCRENTHHLFPQNDHKSPLTFISQQYWSIPSSWQPAPLYI